MKVRRHQTGNRKRAFTLIELVTVIVILAILSVVAIPIYLDFRIDASKSACKGALGGMRSAISNFNAWSLTPAGGGVARFPTPVELTTIGTVIQDIIPNNPFDGDSIKNNVVDATGKSKGTITGTSGGWSYNPTTGEIWANTGTKSSDENTY